jgi:hypothetical protein
MLHIFWNTKNIVNFVLYQDKKYFSHIDKKV